MILLSPKSPATLSLPEVNALRRTKVSASFGPLFLSMFLVAMFLVGSTAFTRALHAQAPAAGTTVAVKMLDAVDSSSDPAGKQYRASVTKAVTASNGVAIAQGAAATVTLTNSGSGYTAQLSSITLNGQPVAVTSGSASVTGAQSAASSAINSVGSVFGHHVSAPSAVTAVATGQRVVLPPGITLTFVLSQPPAASPAAPTAPAAPAGQPVIASSAPASSTPAPNPAPGPPPAVAPGQHWWMCQYVDPKDLYKPVLGSRIYFSVFPAFPSSAASLGEVGGMAYSTAMVKHFIGYVRQNYKVTDLPENPTGQYTGQFGGRCKRSSDDAATRANGMDMMQKQWASSTPPIEAIQVNFADTPAEDAAIDAKLAGAATASATAAATPTAAANQNYVWCHSAWVGTTGTKLPTGTVLYFSDVFAGTIPPPPSGATTGGKTGNGWAEVNASTTFQPPFFAFLQKKYGFKDAGNYPVSCSASDPPTLAGLQNAQKHKQEFVDMTKQLNGQVVETGWSGH
jgi:hypothetical protein